MQQDEGAMPVVTVNSNQAGAEGHGRSVVLMPQSGAKSEAFPRRGDPAKSPDVRGLLAAIHRLEDLVDEETAALEARREINLDEYSQRKSRSVLELVRTARAVEHLKDDSYVAECLKRLRSKLDKNHLVLQMHLEAVREVSGIIAKAIRDAESDGTYSPIEAHGAK